MAFKVRKLDHRAWPVIVRIKECDAAGNVVEVEQTFVGHFKAFSEREHKEAMDEVDGLFPPLEKDAPANLPRALERNAAYFRRLMVGWGVEVTDESGAPLPYSADALTALVTGADGMAVSAALAQAIGEIRFGVAPAKNSVTSPAPGESSTGPGEVATSLPTT